MNRMRLINGWRAAAAASLILGASPLNAQEQPGRAPAQATRAELEALLVGPGASGLDASAVRARLKVGDFQVGDRIILRVLEDSTLTDTFAVRAGRVLELPSIPAVSLQGVLRSELDSVLTMHIGKYVRNPTVEVTTLVRIGVLGGVGRPGYYSLPADMLVTDAIMFAGGPAGNAEIDESMVMRGTGIFLDEKKTTLAIQQGQTLDQANLQGGDEIRVGVKDAGGAYRTVATISMLLGIPLTIYALTQVF
jgi:protein involved in polysaccharide export with SLBB domain